MIYNPYDHSNNIRMTAVGVWLYVKPPKPHAKIRIYADGREERGQFVYYDVWYLDTDDGMLVCGPVGDLRQGGTP